MALDRIRVFPGRKGRLTGTVLRSYGAIICSISAFVKSLLLYWNIFS
nr:MAG TPA: hypothetical protein [Caudoviricetes sp.]